MPDKVLINRRKTNACYHATIKAEKQVIFGGRIELWAKTLLSETSARLPGMKMIAGQKTNTLSTWKNTLEQTGIATEKSGEKLEEWISNIRSSICPTLAEETLGLPTASVKFEARPNRFLIYNRNNALTTLWRP